MGEDGDAVGAAVAVAVVEVVVEGKETWRRSQKRNC